MMIITKPDASRRTKSRVSIITGDAIIVNEKSVCSSLQGRPAVLVDSSGWIGWLPTEEINIVSKGQTS